MSDVIYHYDIEQNTPEWNLLRCGMPTASEFTKLLTPAKLEASKQVDDYALECAASIWAGSPIDTWEGNYWTERGHEIETEARAWYALNWRNVTQCGFIENTELKAGCSPDGLVNDGKAGLLEIKCFGAKEHIRTLAREEIPAKYTIQPHGQIAVSERLFVDMLFYHPSLPKRVWRVWRTPKIDELLKRQIKVCNERIAHYLQVIERAA